MIAFRCDVPGCAHWTPAGEPALGWSPWIVEGRVKHRCPSCGAQKLREMMLERATRKLDTTWDPSWMEEI